MTRAWKSIVGMVLIGSVACGGSDPGSPLVAALLTQAAPSGNNQSGFANQPLPSPLRARLLINGHPESGRTIVWTVSSGSGRVTPASSLTDVDGITFATWTLGATAGNQTVRASLLEDPTVAVSFTATSLDATLSATVSVRNNQFVPATTVVQAGGIVTFTWNEGSIDHNVLPVPPQTVPQSPASPQTFDAPSSYDQIFPVGGTFDYFCSVHGSPGAGMAGTVIVE